ncbi:MAG: FecR family protein [Pyrinomonadaceae bacterium]
MNRNFVKALTLIAVCFLFSTFSFAQKKKENKKTPPASDLYVISAKAGAVNFISGNVAVARADGSHRLLKKGDSLEVADVVSTDADGKAEILLNPGSFVRLAENSEFEFATTSLDDLQIKINRGSAIFEVVTTKDFKVDVKTPKSGFSIIKSGIYRVDVAENGTAKIEVWKGKAQLDNQTAVTLKGGQASELNEGQVAVVKFDRDDKDAFEIWSKSRAKELAKLNADLLNRQMNRALMSYSRGFVSNSGFGLWVQDPFSRSFCFLPYSYRYNSPYGYGYNSSVWGYQYPANIYNNNQNNSYNPQQSSNPNTPQTGGNPTPPPSNPSPPPNVEPNRPLVERPTIFDRKGEPRID